MPGIAFGWFVHLRTSQLGEIELDAPSFGDPVSFHVLQPTVLKQKYLYRAWRRREVHEIIDVHQGIFFRILTASQSSARGTLRDWKGTLGDWKGHLG